MRVESDEPLTTLAELTIAAPAPRPAMPRWRRSGWISGYERGRKGLPMTDSWSATRFDGRSAAGDIVLLRIDGDALVIMSRNTLERVPLAKVAVPEAFEQAPRMLGLAGGQTLEVPDPSVVARLLLRLRASGPPGSYGCNVVGGSVVIALAVLLAAGVWTYVEGLPIAARHVAESLPAGFDRRIGENLLALLDGNTFEPSTLAPEHQARLVERFRRAAAAVAPGTEVRVEFRAGQVNALALPGGIIVVFDELVELAGDDERVLGVLGHELGHVVYRHSTRQLLQALGVARSRRRVGRLFVDRVQRSADSRRAALWTRLRARGRRLRAGVPAPNALSPRPLYEFFVRAQGLDGKTSASIPDFLSTHPDTASRIERLRREVEAYKTATVRP